MHNRLYKFFLILGLIGIIDIVSRQFISISGLGIVSLAIAYIFGWILGADIAGLIAVILSAILSFSLIYLILAFFLRRKAQQAHHD